MYNAYFGFREAPFSVTPDPRFFYTNALYQEALATLRYGIEGKKGFVAITGEAGTGKTTLLRKLMRNLEATIHSVFVFNTHLTFMELLRNTLRDLDLPAQKGDKCAMIEQLNRYLIEQANNGHIVSLLIDEAQNLSDKVLEGLRLLSNLETDKEKLLQIVLMGQPELETKLDRPGLRQLKQRVALQCRLAPLDGSEVGSYIDLRLHAAYYEGEELFDADAIEQIALYSRGIPRLINIICDNALLMAYATSQKKISVEIVREVAHDIRLGLETHVGEKETSTDAVPVTPFLPFPSVALSDGAAPSAPVETIPEGAPEVAASAAWISNPAPTSANGVAPKEDNERLLRGLTNKAPGYWPRDPIRAGVWASLLLIFFGGAAYTMHAKNRVPAPRLKAEQELIVQRPEFLEEHRDDRSVRDVSRIADAKKVQTPEVVESSGPATETEPQENPPADRIAGTAKSEKVAAPIISDAFPELEMSPQDNGWLASPILRPPQAETGQISAKAEAVSGSYDYPQSSEARDPGKELLAAAEQTKPEKSSETTVAAGKKSQTRIYRVKEGEHLYAILRKLFGIDGDEELRDAFNQVKELNLWKKNWDILFVGEKLVFPRQVAAVSRSR